MSGLLRELALERTVEHLFALVAHVGPFVLGVVQPRVQDDGRDPLDDVVCWLSVARVSRPCPPRL